MGIVKSGCIAALLAAGLIGGCDKSTSSESGAGKSPSTSNDSTAAVQPPPAKVVEKVVPKPVQPTEVVVLESLLNRIPADFKQSEEGGWDKFTMPKVQKWVQENLYGKRGSIVVAARACSVGQDAENPKPDEWNVRLDINGVHTNYSGMGNRLLPIGKGDDGSHQGSGFGDIGKASFAFKCNEAEAQKWDAHGKVTPTPVQVVGDVVEVTIEPRMAGGFGNVFVGYDTFVRLDNVTVTRAKDLDAVAVYAVESAMGRHGRLREPSQAITEMKRLESNGENQLVFMKYWHDKSGQVKDINNFDDMMALEKQNRDNPNGSAKKDIEAPKAGISAALISFPLIKDGSQIGCNSMDVKFTPCDTPPTPAQIEEAKAKVKWHTSDKRK